MSSNPAIELVDADIPRVQVSARVAVVEDVTWRVDKGEFWAVGALPGTGKTDLLCTAAGLQKPLEGELRLFGRDTAEMSEEELVSNRLRVAMVFATGRLFMHQTVAQNVALPLAYHHGLEHTELNERVDAALELTGIEDLRGIRPAEITRNLHQRIGLARALALVPEVLLVDNPLLGIDPRQGRWWLEFLCQLHRGHPALQKTLTIIIATDDLRPWSDTAAQFAVLKDRHLNVIGGREELKNTTDPIVRELMLPAFT